MKRVRTETARVEVTDWTCDRCGAEMADGWACPICKDDVCDLCRCREYWRAYCGRCERVGKRYLDAMDQARRRGEEEADEAERRAEAEVARLRDEWRAASEAAGAGGG